MTTAVTAKAAIAAKIAPDSARCLGTTAFEAAMTVFEPAS
jgi:hypothetical protein